MNEALQWLRDKYAVKADGTLTATAPDFIGAGAELKLADGMVAKLLPWRQERRFVELKKLVDGKTLEDVSTLRFAAMSAEKSLEQLLYRELDLCAWLGESPIVSAFAVTNGKTANAIVKLADDKSCSIECSAALPRCLRPHRRYSGSAVLDLPVHQRRRETLHRYGYGTVRVLRR